MWRVPLIVGVFYLATIRAGHDWGDDFAQYIQHARNFATGVRYAETGYIYNPHNPAVGPRSYPPGFPLLLAPVVRVFGLDLAPMKVLIVVCFVGVLLLMGRVFRRDLPAPYTAALILVMGVNPYFWDFKDQVLSDIPFLFFTLLSLYSAQRVAETGRRPLAYAALAGIAAYAAIATRVLGIVLIPCFIAHDLLRRRRIRRPTALACGIAIALAGFQYVLGAQDGSYFDTFTPTAATVGRNVVDYLRALSDIWDNGYSDAGRKLIFVVTLALAASGYVRALRSGPTMLEIFPLLYAVPVVLWPANQGTRFLIPLIPFYFYYCMLGVRGVEVNLAARKRGLWLICMAVVALAYGGKYSTLRYGSLLEGVATVESVELFDFVRRQTVRTDVFVFSKPRALALFAERRASAPFIPQNACVLWRYFREIGAAYVITGPRALNDEGAAYLDRFVSTFSRSVQRVMGNSQVAVYRIAGDPCPGAESTEPR
jgi:4-amino-4-deoxy-L-arabinose transferase-like glycosyltransferase